MLGTTLRERYKIIKPLGQGGFGETYLAEDRDLPGNPQCVVKQLKPQFIDPLALQNARRLFEQEAEVLYTLGTHDQIPRLLAHFQENGEFYLVQELIAGEALNQELTPGKRFSEEQVVTLLQDVLKVLEFVHQQKVIHRDIKPANLIRRKQDGKLVLIDFGAVKKITTLEPNVPGHAGATVSLTIMIGTRGYMPNEQQAGEPKFNSDIYALGMTAIQALTGIAPNQLEKNLQTGEVIWREQASVSNQLVAILNKMVRSHFSERYQSASEVLKDLHKLLPPRGEEWLGNGDRKDAEERQTTESKIPSPKSQRFTPHWRPLRHVLLSSIAVTGLMLVVRSLGVLQPLELWAFDRLLTLRPTESPDSRFLIVTINEADIQAQDPNQRQGSLSDKALNQLLNRLEPHQPRAIGIDIYRDFATRSQYPTLIAHLRQNKHLITICKSSDTKYDPTGIAPPPEVPTSRVGFSDFLEDDDGVLRRQLLFADPDPASPCTTPYSFNVKLVFRYLEAKGISPQFTTAGNLKLGNVVFKRLQARTGGYQGIDAAGNQIMLNYRSLPSLRAITPEVSLNQVLNGKVRPEAIKDRIILVGSAANSSSDFWATPYGTGTKEKVPGVFIQAQMTSQMLSAVLDGRSLIWVWNWAGEALWIGTWALMGGFCVGWVRLPLQRGVTCVIALGTLTGLSFALLTQGGWVPLVPAAMTLVITVGICSYIVYTND